MQTETKIDEQVINRLRESKKCADAESEQRGKEAGRDWAEKQAESDQLLRLAAFVSRNDGWPFEEEGEFEFLRIINPHENPSSNDRAEFWGMMTNGEETPDPRFVEAFARGAVEFWEEMEGQL